VRDEAPKPHQSDKQCKRDMFEQFLPPGCGVCNTPERRR
jgi:hypothetical protein